MFFHSSEPNGYYLLLSSPKQLSIFLFYFFFVVVLHFKINFLRYPYYFMSTTKKSANSFIYFEFSILRAYRRRSFLFIVFLFLFFFVHVQCTLYTLSVKRESRKFCSAVIALLKSFLLLWCDFSKFSGSFFIKIFVFCYTSSSEFLQEIKVLYDCPSLSFFFYNCKMIIY